MQISARPLDRHPDLDVKITIMQNWQRKDHVASITIVASGPEDARVSLRQRVNAWAKSDSLSPKLRMSSARDDYEVFLRTWPQVVNTILFWLGDGTFRDLLDQELSASRRDHELRNIKVQICELNLALTRIQEAVVAQGRSFQSAAATFLKRSSELY